MRSWMRIALVLSLVLLSFGGAILAVGWGNRQLPAALMMPDASDTVTSGKGWSTTEGSYQTPSNYDQISHQLVQQMTAQGWTSLKATRNLGPSIFNPEPAPLLFQRAYWFGLMYETARVSGTNDVPTRVHVIVTRVIRWPPVVRRMIRWWYSH